MSSKPRHWRSVAAYLGDRKLSVPCRIFTAHDGEELASITAASSAWGWSSRTTARRLREGVIDAVRRSDGVAVGISVPEVARVLVKTLRRWTGEPWSATPPAKAPARFKELSLLSLAEVVEKGGVIDE